MKRFLSLCMVLTLLLSVPVITPVFAEVNRSYFDFESGAYDESCFTKGTSKGEAFTVVSDDTEASNDVTLSKYLKMSSTGTYPSFYWKANKNALTLDDGQKIEMEFDMNLVSGSESSKFQFRFNGLDQASTNKIRAHYRLVIETNGKLNRYVNDSSSSSIIKSIPLITGSTLTNPNGQGWKHYKITFEAVNAQLANSANTFKAIKLTGFYIDGINQIDTSAAELQSTDPTVNPCIWAAFNTDDLSNGTLTYVEADARVFNNLYITPPKVTDMRFDNMSFTTYSADDTAPAERGVLISEIRAAQKSYNKQYAESGSDVSQAEYFAEFMKSINDAWTLYQGEAPTETDITTAIKKMEAFSIEATEPVYIWNDNFETNTVTKYTDAEGKPSKAYDESTFASDVTLNKTLKVTKGSDSSSTNYPRVAAQFTSSKIAVDSAAGTERGKNAFAEFEYDLNLSNAKNSSGAYSDYCTYLIDTTKAANAATLLIQGSTGKLFYGYNDKNTKQTEIAPTGTWDFSRTNRIKIVLQLTDEYGNPVQKVNGIYINGIKLNTEALDFVNLKNDGSSITAEYINRMLFRPSKIDADGSAYYIDNVKICTYNKKRASDNSPVEDDTDIVVALRNKYYEESIIEAAPEGRYSEALKTQITASISALEGYYTSKTGNKTEILNAAEAATQAFYSANTVVVYSGTPGTAVAGDGVYGASSLISKVDSTTPATANFDTAVGMTADTEKSANSYVMTEFEVKTKDFKNNTEAVLTASLNSDESSFTDIKLIGGEHPYISLSSGEKDIWYGAIEDDIRTTVRVVTQITDENKALVNINTALFVNGNNVMLRTSDIPGREFKTAPENYSSLSFTQSGSGSAYIDNIRVVKYYGSDNMPVNKGQLLNSIRKGDAKLEKANALASEDIISAYTAAQNTAKSAYESNDITQTEINNANDMLCRAYSKFVFRDESAEIGAIHFADSTGNDAAYVTANGKVTGVSVIKKAEYNFTGTIIAAVYKDDELIGAALANNVLSDKETGTYDITFANPIKLPSNTDGLTVKAMIWSDLSQIIPLADEHTAAQNTATIYIAGDSIVQTYNQKYNYPRDGWGAYAKDYYTSNISQNNLAVSGYTLRSYIDDGKNSTGKMQQVEENIKKGDYFFVSFMANDSSSGGAKYVELSDYKNLLRYYGDVARKHGAQVVYITSPAVLNKDAVTDNCYQNGKYPEAMRSVAEEYNAPLVDLYAMRKTLQQDKGYDYVESAMYLCNEAALKSNFDTDAFGSDFIKLYYGSDSIAAGTFNTSDKTHISVWGSKWCASKIAETLKDSCCNLRYSVDSDKFYAFSDEVYTGSES